MGLILISRSAASRQAHASTAAGADAAQLSVAPPSATTVLAPPSSAPAPPATPADVVIRIETTPSKARVFVGGEDRGLSPVELRMPRATEVTEVEIRRDGYQTQREKVTPETDQKIKLTLVPAAAKGAAPKGSVSGNPYKRFD